MRGGLERLEEINNFGRSVSFRSQMDDLLEIETIHLLSEECDALRPDYHAALAGLRGANLFKVHDAWVRAPDGRPYFDAAFSGRTLYIVRDPRDVVVSWARFTGISVDTSIDFLNDPGATIGGRGEPRGSLLLQKVGCWSDHVASWVFHSKLDLLVSRYEDMVQDPASALTYMVYHLGWKHDSSSIERAVADTKFERLAQMESHQGITEKSARTERFFHTGHAGTWRAILTPEQVGRIETANGEMMARFGYL